MAPVNPVDNQYWGMTLTDPYQYLENLEDTVVRNWMIDNADYARAMLDDIPGRSALVDKMKEFDERVSDRTSNLTILDNDRYFYLKTMPEDETGKLFVRDGFDGTEKLSLSLGGVSWLPDGKHFLYTKVNSADVHDPTRYLNTKSFLHELGTDQGEDQVFFSGEKYPSLGIQPQELPVTAGSVYVRTKGHKFKDIWVSLTGRTLDGQRYRYTPEDGTFTLEQLSQKAEYPEFSDMVVEELMVPSHDGVEVPLSLIYKKGLKMDGSAPLLIYGYGSYGSANNPGFSANRLLWCMDGGIWAVAHVRGGGALGDDWRLAGYKTTKPNTWKDLIAVTEYLQNESYTSPEHTAILGGSAGGILVGRAMTDRPDLFKVVLPLVGVMNNVRMEQSPNGPTNIPEFGTVEDSVEFLALLEMDSYHHLVDGVKYPATLVTAGMNDPRVIAWQPGKFAARLQAANTSNNPILFLVNYKAGHGIGNTKSKNWEDMADYLSFAFWQTGHPDYQR